jgi:hypothetical protein
MNWRGRRWRFETTLTPEECAERLRPAVDGYFKLFGGKPVVGRVNARGVSLRKRIGYNNGFQTLLSASFRRDGATTFVEGHAGMSLFAMAFMVFWCGGVMSIAGRVVVSTLSGPNVDGVGLELALFPLGMIAIAAAIVVFGRWLARDEAAFLISFLRRRLDATASAF